MNGAMNRSVLVVDDEAAMRVALQANFQQHGWEVETAGGAAEAIRKFEQRPFPLVVTDVRMPDGDGFNVMRSVRLSAPETAIIFQSPRTLGEIEIAGDGPEIGHASSTAVLGIPPPQTSIQASREQASLPPPAIRSVKPTKSIREREMAGALPMTVTLSISSNCHDRDEVRNSLSRQ